MRLTTAKAMGKISTNLESIEFWKKNYTSPAKFKNNENFPN